MDTMILSSPIGFLAVACNADNTAITEIRYVSDDNVSTDPQNLPSLVQRLLTELTEYFAGTRRVFDIPLQPISTSSFRQKVWQALRSIPYGETCTYTDIACRIGNPLACRAIGGANHHNPIAILIPCHRVVGANGSLTGYAGGLDRKQFLLRLEQQGSK